MSHPTPAPHAFPRTPVSELARLFLRLGATAFGGPAAHVALMEDEIVSRRGWLTRNEFLDYVSAANVIPGPNSTELAIHIGYARAGWPGFVVAGASFIVPAAVMVGAMAWAYVQYGTVPEVAGVLYGIKPVVIAIVVQALWRLGRWALRSPELYAVAAAGVVALVFGIHELLVLAMAGLGVAGFRAAGAGRRNDVALVAATAGLTGGSGLAAGAAGVAVMGTSAGLWPLFLIFVKIGAVLFGSGYVLLAFLRADFVERLGWLTEQQLLDATAVGQITPGPLFTTATFIGYLLAGPLGAIVSTVGIFLPAFVFVALSGPLVPRLRRSRLAGAALDGVNAASLALMIVVAWQLGWAAIVDVLTVALAGASLAALLLGRVNPTWLVLVGGLAGWLATLLAAA
jgi:chromate transporter